MNEVFDRIAELGVIPVIACERLADALPLADALIAGGLPVAEITFRTSAAADVIRHLSQKRPEMLVGAGTILSPEDARIAKECGAAFAVAPGLNPRVVKEAERIGLPFVPGVASPSDVERGLEFGLKLLKFFPAEALGGLKLLSAIYAPYKRTGVKFMPTGGVTAANLAEYAMSPAVAAVGGTWLAKPAEIEAGAWAQIREKCYAAAAKIKDVRGNRV